MSSEKPTAEFEQFALIRAFSERIENKVDALITDQRATSAEVRAVSAEVRTLGATTENIRIEVGRLNTRMTEAEKDIRGLKEKDTALVRQQSDHSFEQAAALGGAIAHVTKLEENVRAQGETLDKLVASQSAQTSMLERLVVTVTNAASTVTKTISYAGRGAFVGGFIAGLAYAIWKALGH